MDLPRASADTPRISPCNLCPRRCHAHRDQGERGYCGADDQVMVARAALHFWEEPPISGETGSGTVFLTHCPLHCVYCQNGALASGLSGWPVSVERLGGICLDLQHQGAMNVNFVTPTHYSLALRDAVAWARSRGFSLPVVWNTSGYEEVGTLRALEGTVDVYLTDFKYGDADSARCYSQAPDYPEVALRALATMVELAGEPRYDSFQGQERMVGGVIVRHLLLPGSLAASKDALRRLFSRLGNRVRYSLMSQYTPVEGADGGGRWPELADTVSAADYEELLDFADDLGIEDYFWQDGPAARESFIPAWDGTGVR